MLGITSESQSNQRVWAASRAISSTKHAVPYQLCRGFSIPAPSRASTSSQILTGFTYQDNQPWGSLFCEGKRQTGCSVCCQDKLGELSGSLRLGFHQGPGRTGPCPHLHYHLPVSSLETSISHLAQDRAMNKKAVPALYFILASSIWLLLQQWQSQMNSHLFPKIQQSSSSC